MSSSNTSVSKAWSSIKRHAKEHHESVNAAYASYYGTALPPSTSRPASQTESTRRSSVDKAWNKIKKHAKEHHDSVNAAYTQYYGITTPSSATPASSTESSPRPSEDRH